MKSKLLIFAGVAGMLISTPAVDANADVNISIGTGHPRGYVFDRPPSFIRLASPGFSIAVGASPYDVILSGDFYYLYDRGIWYKAPRYNGPWKRINHKALPYKIRRYRIEQIRKFRDDEYNRRRDRRIERQNERQFDRRDDRRDHHRDGRPMPAR